MEIKVLVFAFRSASFPCLPRCLLFFASPSMSTEPMGRLEDEGGPVRGDEETGCVHIFEGTSGGLSFLF